MLSHRIQLLVMLFPYFTVWESLPLKILVLFCGATVEDEPAGIFKRRTSGNAAAELDGGALPE